MIRIGIIAENENDAKAVKGLLDNNFPNQFYFQQLLPGRNGSQLDDSKMSKLLNALRREFEFAELHYVLYIRDLDALIDDREKVAFRKKRFRRFAKVVNQKAIFMLNIYEIEALILADFDTFKTHIKQPELIFDSATAASIVEPDKLLASLTAYNKGNLPSIIPSLQLETLKANHAHFKAFLNEFLKMIADKKYKNAPY